MSWEARNKEHTGEDLIFQTLDWYCDDFENDKGYPVYKIFVFGVDTAGIPITLCIEEYSPFFFIEVPITWNSTCVWSVKEALNNRSIKTIEFLERKRYYGFENNKIRKFLKLSFYSSKGMRNVKYKIEKETFQIGGKEYKFELYESNIDPILRFTHLRDILTAGWIKVTNFTFEEHFVCSWKNVNSYNEQEFANKISDIRVMYFDIEACSEDGSFPNALKKNDRVTQICCILKDTVTKKTQKFLFNLGTCDSVEDTTVLQYPSEKKMLLAYRQFIVDTDPDVIVGYNIFGFDNGFLFERAKVLEIEETFNYQSKLSIKRTTIQEKILNNQQSGFNNWKMTKIYGRTHIDLLQVIKKDFKLESYKLDYVGEYFLKEGKDDVTPKQIFEAWDPKLGNREKRTIVGKYCVQDTNLCLLLFEKFAVLPNHLEMAKVTRVPLEYLITRGQSIKVFSQIAYETRKAGFLIPILPKMETDSKFQGATVLEAHVGYYTKPVCGLDFSSLYPSVMVSSNMCYSTIVLDNRYLNIKNCEYSTVKCNESLSVSFVQNQPGILSGILQSLWKNRKATKKEMNATKDPFLKTVLNAKQLAIKVSMNSIYGFTGATVGVLPCLEISQAVTATGRQMIEQTQKLAKEMFQCEIVYGDSVTADTPVLIRKDNKIQIMEIQELFQLFDKEPYPQFKLGESGLSEKEQSVPDQFIEVWTASGWSPLKRTIRHYCNKNIYRVMTDTGVVDVTEDHSLLNENLEQIKPEQLIEGQTLFHNYPDTFINMHEYINEIYSNIDFSQLIYTKSKIEASWYYLLGRRNGYNVRIVKNKPDEYYVIKFCTKQKWNDLKQIKKITKLGPTNQFVYDLETEDGTFQAGIGQMIVKNTDSCYVIFPQPVDPDGTLTTLFKVAEDAAKKISETFKKPIEIIFEKYMYPLVLCGKKRYIYLEWTDPKHHNGEIEAKGVELVRRDNCPYVKESMSSMLDPIMFENNLEKGIEEVKKHIEQLFHGDVPIKKLILSKTLRNDYKGFEKKYSQRLPDGRPDTNGEYTWIHTKEIKVKEDGKNVKTGTFEKIQETPNMGHVALVERMRGRDLNGAPKPGDRIPFVYIDTGNPNDTSAQKTEDPSYVIEKNIPIDCLYYFDHQISSPLETILSIIIGPEKCHDLLYKNKWYLEAKKREKNALAEYKRKKEGNRDIRNFFTIKMT